MFLAPVFNQASSTITINISSTTNTTINDLKADMLNVTTKGDSQLTINHLSVDTLQAYTKGSSFIKFAGNAQKQIINCSGDSQYNASNLKSGNVDINARGNSTVRIHCNNQVTGNMAGTSELFNSAQAQRIDIARKGCSTYKEH